MADRPSQILCVVVLVERVLRVITVDRFFHFFLLSHSVFKVSNNIIVCRFVFKRKKSMSLDILFCDPHGARTHDPNIKSVVLYQLS